MAAQRAGIDLTGRQAENVRAKLKRLEDRGWLRRNAAGKFTIAPWGRYFQPVRVAGRLGDTADVVGEDGEDGERGLEADIAGVEAAEIARIGILQIRAGKDSAQ